MCNATTMVPIPRLLPDYACRVDPEDPGPEFGIDDAGRRCFKIDACIVPALLAVWAAGYRTLGCCCGHGQAAGGIITLDMAHGQPTTDTQKRYAEIHAAAHGAGSRVGRAFPTKPRVSRRGGR